MVVEDMFSKMVKFISFQKVTIVALRTKKEIMTRGRVSSNPRRMTKNHMEVSRYRQYKRVLGKLLDTILKKIKLSTRKISTFLDQSIM